MAPKSAEKNGNVGTWVRWVVSAVLIVVFSGTTAGVTAWKLTKSYVDVQLEAHDCDEEAHKIFRKTTAIKEDALGAELHECQQAIGELTTLIAVLKTELTHLNNRLDRLNGG